MLFVGNEIKREILFGAKVLKPKYMRLFRKLRKKCVMKTLRGFTCVCSGHGICDNNTNHYSAFLFLVVEVRTRVINGHHIDMPFRVTIIVSV